MIRGDASDGLPGIKGIGEKGAAIIANNFKHINDVLRAAKNNSDQLSEKHRTKIIESMPYAEIMERLVMCAIDVPVPDIPEKNYSEFKKLAELTKIKEKHGLGASVDRFLSALGDL
jgi:5'-3' exonuclease